MSEPFFSIIIPVYNTEGMLPRCLDSILAQSFDCKEIEIVAVNDDSPNVQQCNAIISLYRTQLNITYIKLDHNMGAHIARTYGVENSTGRYLLFVDPDDFLTPDALQALFTDIQVNGDVDYIWFLFSILYQNGKRESSGFVPDIDAKSVLEDMLTFKLSHNVANRCFNASFAKKHWRNMPFFYAYYNEDYYQMAILHYCSKKRRVLNKPLYVYVQGVGITGVVKYTQEKLKKTVLSIHNVDKYLCEFYEREISSSYIPMVQNYSDRLYIDCIFRSNLEEFVDCASEIIGENRVDTVVAKYILRLQEEIVRLKEREKYFSLIIGCASFLKKLPKRDRKMNAMENITDLSTDMLGNMKRKMSLWLLRILKQNLHFIRSANDFMLHSNLF